MNTPLFNDNLISLRQARAQKLGGDDFITQTLTQEFQERILLIKRDFQDGYILGETTTTNFPIAKTSNIATQNHDIALSLGQLSTKNDVQGHFREAYTALQSDGFFLIGFLGGETLQELRYAFLEAESALGLPATPHIAPMISAQSLANLLQQSGFALPVTDSEKLNITYKSPLALMQDLRKLSLTNPLTAQKKTFMRKELLAKTCEIYAQHFSLENGRVTATFELMFGSGWKPHESQQKPLKRGSAKTSLTSLLERF
jgi:hypothetical protein